MHEFRHEEMESDGLKSSIDVRTYVTDLPALLGAFEDYLRGCGYQFDGKLAIVPDDQDDLP